MKDIGVSVKSKSRVALIISVIILLIFSGFYLNDATSGHNSPEPIWYKTWGENSTFSSLTIINSIIYEMGTAWTVNGSSAYVLQYNLEGNLISEKLFNRAGSNSDFITVSNSSYFVAGITYSNLTNLDIFIQRYDLNGGLLWDTTWGSPDMDFVGMIIIKESNLYIAGGNYDNTSNKGVFFLKYDFSGKLLWEKQYKVIDLDTVSIKAEISGSSIFLKWYDRSMDISRILKYDFQGTIIWNKSIDGRVGSMFVDSSYLYLVSQHYLIHDSSLLKYDLDGTQIWNGSIGGYAGQIVLDDPNIYLTGNDNEGHILTVKYDMSGKLLWRSTWGAALRGWVYNAAYSTAFHDSHIYIGGAADLTDVPYSKAFILKYNQNGNLQWGKTWNTSNNHDEVNAIVIYSDNIYAGGRSSGRIFILKTDLDGSDGRIARSLAIGIFFFDLGLIGIFITVLFSPGKKKHL